MQYLEMTNLKIHQLLIISIFLLTGMTTDAQYKSFSLNSKGDTINAVSSTGQKQGKWVIRVPELRGEPGYEEEGVMRKGVKEGVWRKYTLEGDLLAMENYKNGGKHGLQQYYTYIGDLVREESWKGYDPDAPYDTIAVYGTGSNEIVSFKIVKAEQYSVKNGEWKFYDPLTGRVLKTELFDRGHPQNKSDAQLVTDDKPKPKVKPQEVIDFEKKNSGKKKVKL